MAIKQFHFLLLFARVSNLETNTPGIVTVTTFEIKFAFIRFILLTIAYIIEEFLENRFDFAYIFGLKQKSPLEMINLFQRLGLKTQFYKCPKYKKIYLIKKAGTVE